MFLEIGNRPAAGRMMPYATCHDFVLVFNRDMERLHLLARLLTGDADKAEECFLAAFEECIKSEAVFKEWVPSWSRRTIIKNAVRILSSISGARETLWDEVSDDSNLNSVAQLPPMERFVFVVSVLERYSDADCASLLGCTREEVVQVRLRAFQQLAFAPAVA
jgi:DNA-directed RNA polymerase specialized sigma24 family protein